MFSNHCTLPNGRANILDGGPALNQHWVNVLLYMTSEDPTGGYSSSNSYWTIHNLWLEYHFPLDD